MADRLNYSNRGSTTLVGGISNVDTSLEVADATVFPTTPFLVTIGAEIILVGAKDETANILSSLTRAQEGTSALSHSDGVTVENRITGGTLEQFPYSDDVALKVGTYPSLRAQATTSTDVGLGSVENKSSDDIRTQTTGLYAEVVSSFPTRSDGAVVYYTGDNNLYVRADGEWVELSSGGGSGGFLTKDDLSKTFTWHENASYDGSTYQTLLDINGSGRFLQGLLTGPGEYNSKIRVTIDGTVKELYSEYIRGNTTEQSPTAATSDHNHRMSVYPIPPMQYETSLKVEYAVGGTASGAGAWYCYGITVS